MKKSQFYKCISLTFGALLASTTILNADLVRDDNTEIVTDTYTHLQWQDNAQSKDSKVWEDSIGYCEDLDLGGYDDWRLPNIIELLSIMDDTKVEPAIDSKFKNVVQTDYWTSTTRESDTKVAYIVNFKNGESYFMFKTYDAPVRCVRDDEE